MENNHKPGRNWKKKYMTIKMFEEFLRNDFFHLKNEMREVKWLLRAVAVGIIIWAIIQNLS